MTDAGAPPLALYDVHCHVHGEEFDADRAEVLDRAARAGLRFVLAMGEGLDDNRRVLEAAAGHPMVLPCLGQHPDRATSEPVGPVLEQIRVHAGSLAAVGEVGLDFWIAKGPEERERQREALEQLVALALELDLPLSVHSRSAGHQAIDLLAACGARRVCLHAFDGAAKHAARAVELHGYLFSVPPSVVRSPQKQKLVRRLPLSSLLLETDSPVLGPDREARNVPQNITVAADAISGIKGCAVEEVERICGENARRLFRLDRFSGSRRGDRFRAP
jgi:TatD DNase family protein